MSYQVSRFRNPGKRNALFTEDGYKCAYCMVDFTTLPARLQTVDHILPRTAGGTNEHTNLITACHSCNSKRRDTPIHEFVGRETLVRLIRDYPRVARTIVECMTRK